MRLPSPGPFLVLAFELLCDAAAHHLFLQARMFLPTRVLAPHADWLWPVWQVFCAAASAALLALPKTAICPLFLVHPCQLTVLHTTQRPT